MATLNTFAEVDAELAATADYDVAVDIDKAQRRVAALRRKLDFAQQAAQSGSNMAFALQITQDELKSARAWLTANGAPPSDQQKLRNPSVTHYDQSTLRGPSVNPYLYDGGVLP
jgi:hypothetical protein